MKNVMSALNLVGKTNYVLDVPGELRVNYTLTIGTASLVVFTGEAGQAWIIDFINRSALGTNIRIGLNPAFAPVAGLLLQPGDSYRTPMHWLTDWRAVSSAAGGVLDVAGYWYPVAG